MEKSNARYLPLAAVGAVAGFARYYVRPELTAPRAWSAIATAILAYELSAPEGQLMSEGVDRALEKHKTLTTLAVGTVALHLLNVLPAKADPLHHGLKFLKNL